MFKISDADPRTKPYDVFWVSEWCMLAVELKRVTGSSCYPYRLLRWSSIKNPGWQIDWLTKSARHWGVSLVVVYSDKCKQYKIFDFTQLDFNTKYTFNA